MTSKWQSYIVEGWGRYVLKEKLKCLKSDLKLWSKQIFGSINTKTENLRTEIHRLDIIDDSFGLEDVE